MRITSKRLRNKLKARLPKTAVYLVDKTYKLSKLEDIKKFLQNDDTDKIKYIAEDRDCDDIAWALHGEINSGNLSASAFGFAFSNTHAFNIFMDNKYNLYIVEPQTDVIFPIEQISKKRKSKTEAYHPINIIMM